MEARIRSIVQQTLDVLGATGVSFAVEWPADLVHGDYAVNAALAASKTLGKSPREVAELLVPALRAELGEDAQSIEIAGPGFINITLSHAAVHARIQESVREGERWGRAAVSPSAQRIIIEYSCPNPFKEMHVGHLMSTVIGESVARLMENAGALVVRDSYGGDVGPHIAKALWALRREGVTEPESAKQIGDAYASGSRAYEESPKAKAEIDALNQEIYAGTDTELMELWRHGRDVSVNAFKDIYRVLDTSFDYFFFESETAPIGMRIVEDGLARGVFTESDGAVIYEGEKKGLHTLVFRTSRGTPTYEAKDLGLAFLKEERVESDESYILTAAEQIGHFQVFLAALEDIAPKLANKTHHVPHGFLRLTTGKMSSREGNVVTAAGLIDEVLTRAMEKNSDPLIAQSVAVGALKYMILRASPGSDIIFDPEKSLSLDGDSGPYLQYSLVRALSVLEKEGEGEVDTTEPQTPYELSRMLYRFPEVARNARVHLAPHTITQYLTQLAGAWNSFYSAERIVGGVYEAHKREVARAFVTTMRNGLTLLGIPVPERM